MRLSVSPALTLLGLCTLSGFVVSASPQGADCDIKMATEIERCYSEHDIDDLAVVKWARLLASWLSSPFVWDVRPHALWTPEGVPTGAMLHCLIAAQVTDEPLEFRSVRDEDDNEESFEVFVRISPL